MKNSLLLIALLALVASCKTEKNIAYLRDLPDSVTNKVIADTGYKSLLIKPDDLLQINITSPNMEANQYFVTPGPSGAQTPSTTGAVGSNIPLPNTYLVDKQGIIDLPMIGRMRVTGLTTSVVKDSVQRRSMVYLKEPIVSVRLQNFKLTVLGEVARPGNYLVPNERVSVLDALGYAGDLTIFGKRENVLLIREENNKKRVVRLNLNSSDLLTSPYFYLQQNDMLYVEPNKSKAAATDMAQIRTVSLITAVTGLLVIVASRLIK